ncbi:MAG: 5-oxoprolinase subunit PxpA [Salibacteraceae bacterium]
MGKVDVNCDLGEQADSTLDREIMPFISSCNIACGGHAGNAASVKRTVAFALENRLAIGAHPSYPDRENFGRRPMVLSSQQLAEQLVEQVGLVEREANRQGSALHHIKLHGALYHQSGADAPTAQTVVDILSEHYPKIKLYGAPQGELFHAALQKGVHYCVEAFADRAYEKDGSLRLRSKPDAVLKEWKQIENQLENLLLHHRAITPNQIALPLQADTICVHSDTPGAVAIAQKIHAFAHQHGIAITAA